MFCQSCRVKRAPRAGRAGFTLIEILVATAILLVIVVLASMVFQQTTGAYQSGERKVAAQVALRNIIGSITRDLAQAVDSSAYDGLDINDLSSGSSITFLALTGTPGLDDAGNPVRTVQVITYSYDRGSRVVTRKQRATTCANGRWDMTGPETSVDLNDANSALSDFAFEVRGDNLIPDCVYIRAEMETTDRISSVGAGSGGRNGQFESGDEKSDDIYVGLNPNL